MKGDSQAFRRARICNDRIPVPDCEHGLQRLKDEYNQFFIGGFKPYPKLTLEQLRRQYESFQPFSELKNEVSKEAKNK
jgi:hypothetical protein